MSLEKITKKLIILGLILNLSYRHSIASFRTPETDRFLSTYRWDEVISEAERKYEIEEGTLAGLIMAESMGDPLGLSKNNDGGAGIVMFQPGTAKAYGLKVYGTSDKTGRDTHHGAEIRKLVETNNSDHDLLSSIDERFNVEKSTNAAAKLLFDLYKRYRSWDKAISAYNRGTPARQPILTPHVKKVRKFQEYYLRRKYPTRINKGYSYVRTNLDGSSIFSYTVKIGDNPTAIARNFNIFDKENGDKFNDAYHSNIIDQNGRYVGADIHPNQKVYIKIKSKH